MMYIPDPIARFDRIYYLIGYLAGLRMGATVEEIAEAVNKHERTVRRDIRALDSILGINVIREKGLDRRIRFRIEKENARFRPLVFNTYEILALYFILPKELGGKVYSESSIAFLKRLIDARP